MANPFDLSGRIALVTGSSRGIGFALARGLGEAGATVIVNGRDAEGTREAVKALEEGGVSASASIFDVTDATMVREAIDRAEAMLGPVDILVNNAGMQHRAPVEEFPLDIFRRVIDTNLQSAFYVSQAAIPHISAESEDRSSTSAR